MMEQREMAESPVKLPEKGREFAVRYVVLHHTGVEPEHYDLMALLPGEEKLATWRIVAAPDTWTAQLPSAERIADHRAAYLGYEGTIFGGRGQVRRVAAGDGLLIGTRDGCTLKIGDGITLSLPAR
jgi:hypothetical protein